MSATAERAQVVEDNSNNNGAASVKENPGKRRMPIDTSDILWIVACLFVVHKFDFIDAIRYDSRIHRLAISRFFGNLRSLRNLCSSLLDAEC